VGRFRAQATWRFTPSYVASDWRCLVDSTVACPIVPTRLPSQVKVGKFDTVDLLFRYSFKSDNWAARDLDLTLNINNLFNSHPPFSYTQNGGVIGGQTLGRLIEIGLSKKF
jgi:outer membrane receptor protein involved in Fe transport